MNIPQLLDILGISLNNAIQAIDAAGCGANGLYFEKNEINPHRVHITKDQYKILQQREEDIRIYAAGVGGGGGYANRKLNGQKKN